jgi:type IV secretion system protein VirB9
MRSYKKIVLSIASVFACIVFFAQAEAALPITTDSRIKTFVYNENEVFRVTIQYGYQSSIEFAENEEIETISVGNSYSWKITPVGRRIFLKALEGAAHTNMTVITDKRTYQIEIESKYPDESLDDELVYVVRFFYPETSLDEPLPSISTEKFIPKTKSSKDKFNFNYTLSGPETISPIKVFDDGKYTFLKFINNNSTLPHLFTIDESGKENRVMYSREGEYIVIKQIARKLALRLNEEVVFVFNES